jgi:hypothetical protein
MQIIGETIAALLMATNMFVSPARAIVPGGVCAEEAFVPHADCAMLEDDSCRAACDDTDWEGLCYGECCQVGGDYGEGGECDPKCIEACEYNRWGDCYYSMCESTVLFCDSAPIGVVSDPKTCSKYLCDHSFAIEGLACDGKRP